MTPYETLLGLCNEYRFDEASTFLANYDEAEQMKLIVRLAKKHASSLAYAFTSHMLQKEENNFWHQAASTIAFETFPEKTEAHKTGLYHLLKAIEFAPFDWKMKESALKYHQEGILPERYTKPFAEAVLRQEPTNPIALRVVEMEEELI